MAERLQDLIDERVHYIGELQRAELKALQEQIKPHFLYNTLGSIICLAQKTAARKLLILRCHSPVFPYFTEPGP